jgi:transcriptional regulator with XRE-family HTH domain
VRQQPDPTLAALVKQLREEHGVTQEELAFQAKITVSSLSRIERGLNSPAWTTVARIMAALDVPMSELIARLEQPAA